MQGRKEWVTEKEKEERWRERRKVCNLLGL
jgi:hypothetical protein